MAKIVDLSEKKDTGKSAGDSTSGKPAKSKIGYNPLRHDDGAKRNEDVLSWTSGMGMKGSH
jgi:hypothetical protein